MSNYFLHDGSNQKGPFTLEELIKQGIDKNSNVWKEGSPDWVKAGELEELSDHFRKIPPPLYKAEPTAFPQEEEEVKKKSKLPYIIVLIAIVAGIAGYFIWKQNNPTYEPDTPTGDESNISIPQSQQQPEPVREKTPEELKAELAVKEQSSPTAYLSLNGTYRKNFIGETVLEGTIRNTATAAIFKDIEVKAGFLAPSGTVLEEKTFTVYVMLGPSQSTPFKVKVTAPKQTESVSMNVVNALAVE